MDYMNPVRSLTRDAVASLKDLGGATSNGMKLELFGKNIKLDGPLEVFVEDKIGGLDKFIGGGNVEARVEIGLPSRHHRAGDVYYAEVNLKIGGKLLRATCQHEDMRTAIVDVKRELQKQIKKFKDKRKDFSRKSKEKTE